MLEIELPLFHMAESFLCPVILRSAQGNLERRSDETFRATRHLSLSPRFRLSIDFSPAVVSPTVLNILLRYRWKCCLATNLLLWDALPTSDVFNSKCI